MAISNVETAIVVTKFVYLLFFSALGLCILKVNKILWSKCNICLCIIELSCMFFVYLSDIMINNIPLKGLLLLSRRPSGLWPYLQ